MMATEERFDLPLGLHSRALLGVSQLTVKFIYDARSGLAGSRLLNRVDPDLIEPTVREWLPKMEQLFGHKTLSVELLVLRGGRHFTERLDAAHIIAEFHGEDDGLDA